ncbi:MAG: hypothetical protein A2452_02445 [Candidatus Firestonebacteria bacterium RIFOXYC2_FULL_39_67]|nr:MAG: hypothetical protein A2536_01985 [Candidatus Firestonebacteria bacterium RIFOXYD2_FULL_39_29]OGF55181.1 MAG: hypothetical protein A2452_02445 [Candidatus Firestonebacteria bacterium RIFOXYC2_FULL_39_67]
MENKIEFLSKKDIGQFLKLADHAFPTEVPVEKTCRHIALSKNDRGIKHLGIRDKGKVVSHVGLYPLKMKLPGAVLGIAGIGAVATYEKYRGKGFMKLQLEYAEKLMNENGYDISWLAGERKRYGYFGWENAGRLMKYSITERTTKGIVTSGYTYRKYSDRIQDLKGIIKIHEKDGIGLKRTFLDYQLLFSRLHRETIIASVGSKPAAYITFMITRWSKENGTVLEFGGDLTALKALFRHVIEKYEFKEIIAAAPAFFNRYNELLASISGYRVLENYGMIKIINLRSMLEKFTGQMSIKVEGLNLKKTMVTFEIPELNQKATLEIGENVKVADKPAALKISLNRKDMVRFLFGLSKLSDEYNLSEKYAPLNVILPLDIYMWRLETV